MQYLKNRLRNYWTYKEVPQSFSPAYTKTEIFNMEISA